MWGKTSWPFWGLLSLLFLFYPGLFFGLTASLAGDHWEQHFPWASLLHDSLHHFEFPYWTPFIHCGFPIAAEGQIGIFYLPNLVLSFLLPLRFAYSYSNLVHFLLSGLGTYRYARQMKLDRFPAFIAAFIFVFGAAYGGAFYNITSLKTIAWFPVALFLFENFLEKRKWINLGLMSAAIALSLLAGYLQVALFTWLLFLVYAGLRLSFFWEGKAKPGFGSAQVWLPALSFVGAFVLAAPQLLLTYKLALLSNRVNLSEDYAYVGSMSPVVLLTFIFPIFQGFLRGNCLYGGILSIFLVLCATYADRVQKNKFYRLWVTMAVISLLLALGEWSPLYTTLVKLTRFYSFRVPAKFLVFVCFFVSMIAACGVQAILKMKEKDEKTIRIAARANAVLLSGACAVYAFLYYWVAYRRETAAAWGRWLLRNFIYGRSGHPLSLDNYYEKLGAALNSIQSTLALTNLWNLWSLLMIAAAFFLALMIARSPKRKKTWLIGASAFMILDLYVFAFADIKRDFDSYKHVFRSDPILERLNSEKKEGRVGRIYGFRREGENLPLVPSVNMLYGIEDIGAYSPFVLSRYYESIGQFGNINDSNRSVEPSPEFVEARLQLLASLGVTHILSTTRISHPKLELLTEDSRTGACLYRLGLKSVCAYFVSDVEFLKDWNGVKGKLMAPGFNPQKVLLLEAAEQEKIPGTLNVFRKGNEDVLINGAHGAATERWSVTVKNPGFFILANTFYPGWRATVNGKEVPILKAYGLFQAVRLEDSGQYEIHFTYHPYS